MTLGEAVLKQLYATNVCGGNCGEMTAVAIHLIVNHKLSVKGNVYAMMHDTAGPNIASSFSHIYCAVQTTGGSATQLTKDPICIDPWLNIVCRKKDYADKAKKMLKNWMSKHKRIGGVQINGQSAWAEPTNKVVLDMLKAPAVLYPCEGS